MRRLFSAMILLAVAGAAVFPQIIMAQPGGDAPATQPAAQGQADVPVKGVVLFSSGVGYFEHFGVVAGDRHAELRFKTAQINDILKSLVLQDLDGGKVSTVTYPSQDPIAKTLRSFQIDLAGNPSLADLLNQLRGAKVSVSVGTETVTGTILGVEKKQRPAGNDDNAKVVEIAFLNLVAGGTIRSISLDEIRGLQLEDPQLQEELDKALAALASSRDQDKKPVAIHFMGMGDRRVRIGYVVETPIWKTSYRLILGDGDRGPEVGAEGEEQSAKADAKKESPDKLQGWAIVENQTDNDWNNVQLSLVSGRPISFVQDLYQPLYIPRPVIQPELYASLRPQMYEEGMEVAEEKMAAGGVGKRLENDRLMQAQMRPNSMLKDELPRSSAVLRGGMAAPSPESNQPLDANASVATIASASRIGELFQYTVGNVSLPRQKSAMIPIVTDEVEIEKLSIYNQSVLPRHPLNGARLKNTTGKHLLHGPITVFEANSYAGDARIDDLPPGQERLLSYGIDLQMLVDATKNTQENRIQTGKIVKGVLHVTRKHVFTQEYLAENKSEKDKTLIIEHPIRPEWKLVDSPEPIETTETIYRFKQSVPAGKKESMTINQQMIQSETIAILPADIGQLQLYARTGEIPADVRESIAKAIAMKQAMIDTERQISERQQQINQITQEQNRIRENMRTVDRNSEYYNRLLKKLNEQETQIEKLQTEIESLQEKLDAQRLELESYLGNLSID